ncbi:ubiquitin-associated protein 1 [Copidosoma floridanum]|uniref:ubiquitin-associated protein 1 n=1 Tax=Copidosoma floridanum TaxID=29053 RepID=UPI0006C97303|nr:ubiquitin-associated protein 1 [Copidosoma floridanum]XP_014206143.1 ubiquitin-associated protein 1 [Copidosoma floridanum]
MARSSAQYESVATYMDGVQVEIAEAYQQPKKIIPPPAFYSKMPDLDKCTYDFGREKRLLEKATAWRKARLSATEARRARIEEKRKIEAEKSPPPLSPNSQELTTSPVQMAPATEASIFTPQPSSSSNGLEKCQFNYKEFDVDMSSPFDNMELKTINDMEALAQVLQQPTTTQWAPNPNLETRMKDLTMDQSLDEVKEEDKVTIDFRKNDESVNSNKHTDVKQSEVSLIVQELQKELDQSSIENHSSLSDLESPSFRRIAEVPKEKTYMDPKEIARKLADLPLEDQNLAKRLSDMGFSLPRVTRAICDLKGEDKKKIVKYLLAIQSLEDFGMSEDEAVKALSLTQYDKHKAKVYYESLCTLRDLGFPEDQASIALLKCDIDRDSALDYLIA